MKKGIIFTGKPATGKTKMAQKIKEHFNDSVVYLNGRNFKKDYNFFFASCTNDTKIVIIDDLPLSISLESFFNILDNKLLVNKKGSKPFSIKINCLIIIPDADFSLHKLQNPSTERRFDVIEFPNDSFDFLVNKIKN